MKFIYSILLMSIIGFVSAQDFEGEVVQNVQDFKTNTKTQLKWIVSGDKAAIEIVYAVEGGTSTMVLLPLANGQFAYFSKEKSAEGPNYYYMGTEGESKGDYAMVNPVSSSQIKDYTVDEYIFKAGANESQVWYTEDLAIDFQSLVTQFNSSGYFTQFPGLPKEGFVLQMIVKENGVITSTIEFVEANEKNIPASYFSIPEGYVQYVPATK